MNRELKVYYERQDKLVAAVKAHALEHYTDGGWDVIVEAWDDEQLAEAIEDATTEKEAIEAVSDVVAVYADRQADAVIEGYDP